MDQHQVIKYSPKKARHKEMRGSGHGSIIIPKNHQLNYEVIVDLEEAPPPICSSRIVKKGIPLSYETDWSIANAESKVYLGTHYVHRIANKELLPLDYCVLCETKEHSTQNCMEAPPDKIRRITELGLCCRCLLSGHHANQCSAEGLKCQFCGDAHYEFIFHKPYGWIYTRRSELKAIAAPPATNEQNGPQENNQLIDVGPQEVQAKKEEQALLNRIVDPTESTMERSPDQLVDPEKPLIDFYEGENLIDL